MRILSLSLLVIIHITCVSNKRDNLTDNNMINIGYDLSSPDKIYILPSILHEISGITSIDTSTVACIQDELGTVFFFDLNKNQIVRKFTFGNNADYEGIAIVDKSLYILKSNGKLSEIKDFESEDPEIITYTTGIPWKDNEGLCYDLKNNRLLIAPKETPQKDSRYEGKRLIYEYSLSSEKLIEKPEIIIDLDSVSGFAERNNINPRKEKKGKQKPDLQLRISAIGINPVTGNLFALSGSDRILLVSDLNGRILYIERLNSRFLRQPEGITFMKNGDMLISSEGKKESGTLVRFNYKPSR